MAQSSTAPDGITVVELVAREKFPHQRLLRQWSRADEGAVAQALSATVTADLSPDRTGFPVSRFTDPGWDPELLERRRCGLTADRIPSHHRLDSLALRTIPPHIQHGQDPPPPQQIVGIGPHRQRTDIRQHQTRQKRRDRVNFGPVDHHDVRHYPRRLDTPVTKRAPLLLHSMHPHKR